jgi:hypothetical protein
LRQIFNRACKEKNYKLASYEVSVIAATFDCKKVALVELFTEWADPVQLTSV